MEYVSLFSLRRSNLLSDLSSKAVLCEPLRAEGSSGLILRQPPELGKWTRFKAALFDLPLIGRLPALEKATEDVQVATRLLGEIRREAELFRSTFKRSLDNDFGPDIARLAIAHAGGLRDGMLTPRKVAQIVDRASELSFHGTAERDLIALFGEPIARSAIQRTGSLRGAIHVSDTTVPQIYEYASLRAAQTASRNNEQLRAHLQTNGLLPAEGADINPLWRSLAEGIARMQAIATQPDYFRENLTPAQLATAASLVRQLSAIGFNITQLNSVVMQFRLRLEQAPFPHRQQIAAACIQACINEVNESTITSELNLRRPSVEGAGSSSGIRPQPLEGAHANAVFALLDEQPGSLDPEQTALLSTMVGQSQVKTLLVATEADTTALKLLRTDMLAGKQTQKLTDDDERELTANLIALREQLYAEFPSVMPRRCIDTALLGACQGVESASIQTLGTRVRQLLAPAMPFWLLCTGGLTPEQPLLDPQELRSRVDELVGLRRQLCAELPEDMPWESVDNALREICQGRKSLSLETLRTLTRQRLLVNEVTRLFSAHTDDSVLWNVVLETANAREINANTTALLTRLTSEMIMDVENRMPGLYDELKHPDEDRCPDDLRTLLDRVRARLIANVGVATDEHLQALEKIESSTDLNRAQKQLLHNYVEGELGATPPHRLDLVQLAGLTSIADTIARELPRLGDAAGNDDPAMLFDSIALIGSAFTRQTNTFVEHARSFWAASSFFGTDREKEMFDLCIQLALAKRQDIEPSPALGAGVPMQLASPEPPADRSEPGVDAVRQFRDACDQSSLTVAKLGMLYGDLLRVTGVETFDADAFHADAGPSDAQPSDAHDRQEPAALYRMRPELLVRTLCDPSCGPDGEGLFDARGVKVDGLAGQHVRADYDLATDVNLRPYPQTQWPLDGAHDTRLQTVLAGADVIVNGKRLHVDARDETAARAATTKLHDAFENDASPQDLLRVVTACMHSNDLKNFRDGVDGAAFTRPMAMASHRPAHEIWQAEDGTWRVRSTQISSPRSCAGVPINSDGVVLYTITHVISRDRYSGALRAVHRDARAVFAY